MEKALYLNGEIKDEVYIGYGTLEFGKFPSINERKLPNNLEAEKFKVLFAVHKGYQKRLKEDYINKNYNKFDSKYNNLLTDLLPIQFLSKKYSRKQKLLFAILKKQFPKTYFIFSSA